MDALKDGAVLDAWYPVGSPVDIRRYDIREVELLGRRIHLDVFKTWISPSVDGRSLPVTERLGLVWTTLGRPNGPPQPMIEYYEVDRSTLNVSSEPLKATGPQILEDTLRMLNGADVAAEGEQDDDGNLLLRSDQADLGILGSEVACEVRVTSPHAAIFTFRHRSRSDEQEHRKDFYAVFCQPCGGQTTIAHRITGIVDMPLFGVEAMRGDYPFAATESSQGRNGAAGSSTADAFRSWLGKRAPLERAPSG